ncbi:hypothetical protein HPB48_004635 [Haemaphysalis longicornis]|uniref:Glycoside hydrolase family 2 immunoglobulin-like beta-sandwich domain-containing protein n=1 Tax=Haemaphysalis longicornis TaxID=44386 RepID=A0A9J6G2B1_HAELO|nr:hypothetical protein HPB48_004635 [Haemaphysalis longicornis]
MPFFFDPASETTQSKRLGRTQLGIHFHLGGQQTPGKRDKWALIVALFLEVAFTSKASLLLNLVLDDRLTVKKNITVSANNRLEAHYRFRLRIPESLGIQAWWPNGYGDQKLYTLSVSLSRDHDSATITKSVGFRTVDLVQEPLINSTVWFLLDFLQFTEQ